MAGVLYPPAFTAITRWYGAHRMQALLVLTLVAGLSSTIFAPLTAVLLEHLSWRTTFGVLAARLGLTTVPLHAFALRPVWPKLTVEGAERRQSSVSGAVRSPGFVLLSISFATLAFGFYVASLGLIPLLTERGFSHGLAATTLGLLGAGQLLGRLAYAPLRKRLPPWGRLVVVVVTAAVAALGLAVLPAAAAVLIAAAVVFGAMRGLFTLLQAGVIADRWGVNAYGTLSGIFTAPITVAAAVAPWASATLAGAMGSSTTLFIVLAGFVLASATTGVASWRWT
jgi:predicted MFS family arabinose efflux permease